MECLLLFSVDVILVQRKIVKKNFDYINDFLAFQIGHGKVGEAFSVVIPFNNV